MRSLNTNEVQSCFGGSFSFAPLGFLMGAVNGAGEVAKVYWQGYCEGEVDTLNLVTRAPFAATGIGLIRGAFWAIPALIVDSVLGLPRN